MDSDPVPKTVLVTGANGYIGGACARAFARAGYNTYGLIRSEKDALKLAANEIIPIIGTFDDPSFPFLVKLAEHGVVFDVVISTTEQVTDYIPHYEAIIRLLLKVSSLTLEAGKDKPLVLFTSGCKDYGWMEGKLATTPGLTPHTENSPLNPPPILVNRAAHAIKSFNYTDSFDCALIRPTNVYGLASSYYSIFLIRAQEAASTSILEFKENPETILHALHIDDCGEAYVALVQTGLADRSKVRSECFNMSSYRYETLSEIADALVKEYGIKGGVKFRENAWPEGDRPDVNLARMVFGFSQWTGSEKIRKLTGWEDKRPLFSKSLGRYRIAYEAAITAGELGSERVQNMSKRFEKKL